MSADGMRDPGASRDDSRAGYGVRDVDIAQRTVGDFTRKCLPLVVDILLYGARVGRELNVRQLRTLLEGKCTRAPGRAPLGVGSTHPSGIGRATQIEIAL